MDKISELEMALRHLRLGESHVEHQRQIIAGLRRDGHSTLQSEDLLKTFEATLRSHRDHYELLVKELKGEL